MMCADIEDGHAGAEERARRAQIRRRSWRCSYNRSAPETSRQRGAVQEAGC
jgi:hypothetical protein